MCEDGAARSFHVQGRPQTLPASHFTYCIIKVEEQWTPGSRDLDFINFSGIKIRKQAVLPGLDQLVRHADI